jgi:hypothetical protein
MNLPLGRGSPQGRAKAQGTPLGRGSLGRAKARQGRRARLTETNLWKICPKKQLPAAVDKLRRSRDLLAHTLSNYEEALEKVKKMGYLSKTSMKEKEAMQKLMENTMEKVKQHLVKGEKNKLQVLKNILTEAVKVVKDAKDEAKELVQITMKTQSKASGK